MLVSVVWAPDLEIALNKGVDMLVVAALTILAWQVAKQPMFDLVVGTMHYMMFILAAVLGLLGVANMANAGSRLAVLGGGPNVYGRLVGIGGLCGLKMTAWFAWLGYSFTALFTALVLLTGSRGALASYIVAAGFLFFYTSTISWFRKIAIISVAGILLFGFSEFH